MAHVLVVDDQPEFGRPLTRLLQLAGHDARCVTEGERVMAYVRSTPPDLVLLDVMMPGVDGLELLRQMRDDQHTARLPVVMFTALGDPVLEQYALKKGANDYLVKGRLDFDQIQDRLSRYLACGGGK
jgi:putative two-component system response regulator